MIHLADAATICEELGLEVKRKGSGCSMHDEILVSVPGHVEAMAAQGKGGTLHWRLTFGQVQHMTPEGVALFAGNLLEKHLP